ncbi:hypothetical protein FRC03_004557 [Tulasnella sp. 419]|nr:hypothetical protein FRC03_004557 [Tulasnella sp. 419]
MVDKPFMTTQVMKPAKQEKQIKTRPSSSHSRKQPLNHVPRPPNSFILFRSDFVQSNKLTKGTENDHRNISKIIGAVWNSLPADEKAVWQRKAEDHKRRHLEIHPGYRYAPVVRREGVARRRVKQKLWEGIDSDDETSTQSPSITPMSKSSASDKVAVSDAPSSSVHRLEMLGSLAGEKPSEPVQENPVVHRTKSPKPARVLPPKRSRRKQKDRSEVIAKLYLSGISGVELEEEIRRREELGMKRRAEEVVQGRQLPEADEWVLDTEKSLRTGHPNRPADKSKGSLRKTKSESIIQANSRPTIKTRAVTGNLPKISSSTLSSSMSGSSPGLGSSLILTSIDQSSSMPVRHSHNHLHKTSAPYSSSRNASLNFPVPLSAASSSTTFTIPTPTSLDFFSSSSAGFGFDDFRSISQHQADIQGETSTPPDEQMGHYLDEVTKPAASMDLNVSRQELAATIDKLRKSQGILARTSAPVSIPDGLHFNTQNHQMDFSWTNASQSSLSSDASSPSSVDDILMDLLGDSRTSPLQASASEPCITMEFRDPFALASATSRNEASSHRLDGGLEQFSSSNTAMHLEEIPGGELHSTTVQPTSTEGSQLTQHLGLYDAAIIQRQDSLPFDNPVPPPVPPRNYIGAFSSETHQNRPLHSADLPQAGTGIPARLSPPPPKIPPRPAWLRISKSQMSKPRLAPSRTTSLRREDTILDLPNESQSSSYGSIDAPHVQDYSGMIICSQPSQVAIPVTGGSSLRMHDEAVGGMVLPVGHQFAGGMNVGLPLGTEATNIQQNPFQGHLYMNQAPLMDPSLITSASTIALTQQAFKSNDDLLQAPVCGGLMKNALDEAAQQPSIALMSSAQLVYPGLASGLQYGVTHAGTAATGVFGELGGIGSGGVAQSVNGVNSEIFTFFS